MPDLVLELEVIIEECYADYYIHSDDGRLLRYPNSIFANVGTLTRRLKGSEENF